MACDVAGHAARRIFPTTEYQSRPCVEGERIECDASIIVHYWQHRRLFWPWRQSVPHPAAPNWTNPVSSAVPDAAESKGDRWVRLGRNGPTNRTLPGKQARKAQRDHQSSFASRTKAAATLAHILIHTCTHAHTHTQSLSLYLPCSDPFQRSNISTPQIVAPFPIELL